MYCIDAITSIGSVDGLDVMITLLYILIHGFFFLTFFLVRRFLNIKREKLKMDDMYLNVWIYKYT